MLLRVFCLQRKDLGAARPLLERALAIRLAQGEPDQPCVARVLTDLGTLSCAEGDFDAAVTLYRRAVGIRRAVPHLRHVTATSLTRH